MKIEFEGIIPPIQSGIKIGQDGARIQLEVPEIYIAEALKLAAYGRSKVLKVTIEIDDG